MLSCHPGFQKAHTVNQQHFVEVLPPTLQETANSRVIPWNISNRRKTNGSTSSSTIRSLRRTSTGTTAKQPQPHSPRIIYFLLYSQPSYVAVGPVICSISYSASLIQAYSQYAIAMRVIYKRNCSYPTVFLPVFCITS
jgi:hypothetical protein